MITVHRFFPVHQKRAQGVQNDDQCDAAVCKDGDPETGDSESGEDEDDKLHHDGEENILRDDPPRMARDGNRGCEGLPSLGQYELRAAWLGCVGRGPNERVAPTDRDVRQLLPLPAAETRNRIDRGAVAEKDPVA